MVNVCRGQLAVKWYQTRDERKKEAPQEALTGLSSCKPLHTLRDLWTPQQDALLRKSYLHDGPRVLAERFHRSTAAIKTRARFLGITTSV